MTDSNRPLRTAFVMEQALGHVTHHKNLARWAVEDADLCPVWLPIPEHAPDLFEKLPGVKSNWSLKASLRAKAALREAEKHSRLDAIFIHTQTCSLFALEFMKRIPTVVSLDATPINYDTVGAEYGHVCGDHGWLDRKKMDWYKAVFRECAAITTWCQWAKDSLVSDYGVSYDKVTVIPPGVDLQQWEFGAGKISEPKSEGEKFRLLFVGGDFARKGGPALLEAFRTRLSDRCTIDIVTKDESVHDEPGVKVHRGLTANSKPLRDLYATADVFVFPTVGDCLPIAIMEAMAAGLPIIATNVGALSEEVENDVNGLIVPPRNPEAVAQATLSLIGDPDRLQAMSRESRRLAEKRFSAKTNYTKLLELIHSAASSGSAGVEK